MELVSVHLHARAHIHDLSIPPTLIASMSPNVSDSPKKPIVELYKRICKIGGQGWLQCMHCTSFKCAGSGCESSWGSLSKTFTIIKA